MAKKRETQDTAPFLRSLQQTGWFKNINDTVQVGIPDLLGCRLGKLYGLELKAIREVPEDGIVPKKSEHRFSKKQISELFNIEKNGGVALGIIICGKIAYMLRPSEINEHGQVNVNHISSDRVLRKTKGAWDLSKLWKLEYL